MTGNPEDRTEQEQRAAEAVAALAPARPDPDFRKRLGASFASGEIVASAPVEVIPLRRSRRPFWVAAAAAAVVVIALLSRPSDEPIRYTVLGGDGKGTVVVGGETVTLASLKDSGVPGDATIHVVSGALELQWADVMAVRINPGEVSIPDPNEPGVISWDLALGEVLFQTGPGFPGRQLHVRTPEGEVEVVGTSFAVYRDEGVTCVCILEGIAEVGINGPDMEAVPPGQRKVMHADGSPPEILDIMPAHREGLVDFVDRAKASLAR